MVNTFKLSDLNQNFWEKVLFIQIDHSSGLGGPGAILIITDEMKLFFWGLSELPYNEWTDLGKLSPLLEKIYLSQGHSGLKAVSMGYKYFLLENVLVKEEYFSKYEKIWEQVYDKTNYVHELDVMKLVLGVDSFEKYDLKDTVKRYEHEEIEPFCKKSNATIEQYILYEKDYGIIDGKLSFNNPKESSPFSSKYFCLHDTLDDCDLNSSGEFVRAFKTLDEAKDYALAVADRVGYNKENLINSSDDELIRKYEFKSMYIKHQTIQEFGKYYKEIMELVARYEFSDESTGEGWYLCNEIVEQLGIDREIAKRMLKYIPQILLPQNQRKSKEILKFIELNSY